MADPMLPDTHPGVGVETPRSSADGWEETHLGTSKRSVWGAGFQGVLAAEGRIAPWDPAPRIDLHIVVIGAGPRFQVPGRVGGKESVEELHHGFADCVDFGVCQLREHRQAEDLLPCRFGYWQIAHPLATRGEGRLQV